MKSKSYLTHNAKSVPLNFILLLCCVVLCCVVLCCVVLCCLLFCFVSCVPFCSILFEYHVILLLNLIGFYLTFSILMCDRRICEMLELMKVKEDEYLLTLSNLENKYEYRIGDHMDRYDKLVRRSGVYV